MNRSTVALTATNALRGTASFISIWKQMSIKGMLDPAPERPAAFEKAMSKAMSTNPSPWRAGFFSKGTLWPGRRSQELGFEGPSLGGLALGGAGKASEMRPSSVVYEVPERFVASILFSYNSAFV